MKRVFLISFISLLLLGGSCDEYPELIITLTNPDGKSVEHSGLFVIDEYDTTQMEGNTPSACTTLLPLGGGNAVIEGEFYKTSTDTIDILNLKLFIDDTLKLDLSTKEPYPAKIEFQYFVDDTSN